MTHCALCQRPVDSRVLAYVDELRPPVRRLVETTVAGWQAEAGICPSCALVYAQQAADQRHPTPLNVTTDPHTTFPYYHPAEESLLAQWERLPDYASWTGQGVTIAFLDSGFFPHPDLTTAQAQPDPRPDWAHLTPAQLRNHVEAAAPRLIDYVDLTGGQEARGLDHPALWDDSWLSWHGQMTTTVAAGNGLLSDGHFRGFAPQANVLPIRVGRGDGRIPEEDILAGFRWLLRDDNWERLGVRVVNVSVGGDFPQHWADNPLCLAAEELSRRGVLIAAAAGNSGARDLLAPAQAPSILTVGGYDDNNRRWSARHPDELGGLALYHHNFGDVYDGERTFFKPELLALARYLPAPLLPGTPTFREGHAIGRLRHTLLGGDTDHLGQLLAHWHRVMHVDDERLHVKQLLDAHYAGNDQADSVPEIWRGLRKRMNAHKWVHPFYQHVDGTSVAVAQVSAVAAQMFQANPHLTGEQVKAILLATATDMSLWPEDRRGAGLLQPVDAVAAALRAPGGVLTGYPRSASTLTESRLRKWMLQGTLSREDVVDLPDADGSIYHYFGFYAPSATMVSLLGAFNHWTPGVLPLRRMADGWWHLAVRLPAGDHPYRFWVSDRQGPTGRWCCDPENPHRVESGYRTAHSLTTT